MTARRITALAIAVLAGAWVLTTPGPASAAGALTLDRYCGPAEGSVTITVTGSGVFGGTVYLIRPNGDRVGGGPAVQNRATGAITGTFGFDVTSTGNDNPAPPAIAVYFMARGAKDPLRAWYTVGRGTICGAVNGSPQDSAYQPGGTNVGVTVWAFSPLTPVTVTVPGAAPVTVKPDLNGTGQVVVPTDGLTCGANRITATQAAIDEKPGTPPIGFAAPPVNALNKPGLDPPPRTASTSITVYCPTIAVAPSQFGDTALPGPASVSGSGWYVHNTAVPVQFALDGVAVGQATPNATGHVSGRIRLPRAQCGVHTLAAVQAYDNGDGFSITLTAQATVTVRCAAAELAVDPPVAGAGRTVDAIGGKFVPGRTVTLEWTLPDGTPLGDAGSAVTEADGTFRVTILVMPNSDLGARKLHALETPPAGDPVGAREGFADVLIVPGSMAPGRHHFLERR
ncbi:MAG: hypothetical protein QOD41_3686 [Cryptosporangiaceae bacterium]|nr:hypothetical protein [Cryptosporangiaceae bacterium]